MVINTTYNLQEEQSIGQLSTTLPSMNHHKSNKDFYIGLSLALMSSFFIGSSFILKKKGLLKLSGSIDYMSDDSSNKVKRAGQGGYGYLKEWLWWSGLLTMALGEICNFAAYGFVPATLVTPLGALSVLISAILSAYFLDEKLSTIGKIGCFLTAIGSTIMVIHAPKEGEIKTVHELLGRVKDPEFIIFTILCVISTIVLIFMLVPRYGNTNVLIYILICSILGSFTVMSCKGLFLGVKEILTNKSSVSHFFTYMFAILVLILIVLQMNYLNKSLDTFNTAVVTTVYYVLFTLFVMINSSLLFKELLSVSFQDFVGCMCGFSVIACALFMIHFFKPSLAEKNDGDSNISVNNPNDYVINNNRDNADTVKKRDIVGERINNSKIIKASSLEEEEEEKEEEENYKERSPLQEQYVFRENHNNSNLVNNQKDLYIKPVQPVHNFGMLDIKQETNSFLKRLTDKNMYKNYFNQFKSLNSLKSSYNYNMLLTSDENETATTYSNHTQHELKLVGNTSYEKLKTSNNDDDDFDKSLEIHRNNNNKNNLITNSNQQNFFKLSTKFLKNNNANHFVNRNRNLNNSNRNKSKNLSFDENFFGNESDKEESLLSTSLNTQR